jgi:hypothetical protein
MILGFDHDDITIFEAQRQFLQDARIVSAMVGMLHAIPKTPLHARLAQEDRLDPADEPEFGTNVIPLGMSRVELRDGYVRVLNELYEPDAYFQRLEDLYLKEKLDFGQGEARYWRRHRWSWLKSKARNFLTAVVLFWRLMREVPEASLRREYRKRIGRFLKARHNPNVLTVYLLKCALHYHQHTLAKQMALGNTPIYNSF